MRKDNYLYFSSISAIAGRGGHGCVSFIRTGRMPKGGPDGGNGGNGGSIYVVGDEGTLTLSEFRRKRYFKAGNGQDGSSSNRTGKNGSDEVIKVPLGAQIWVNDELILDVTEPNHHYLLAKGGIGGLGNAMFATPDLTTPYISTKGEEGDEIHGEVRLKYFADVGLIGLPNAGKSTFVHKVSNAKVKIGDYPFSTLEPVIGVCEHDNKRIIVADLPGLIEGAHMDIGLGHQFLQHLDRCKILLHLVDASDEDAWNSFCTIRNEVKIYDPQLLNKNYIVVLSKCDTADDLTLNNNINTFIQNGIHPSQLSDSDHKSINSLLDKMFIISEGSSKSI